MQIILNAQNQSLAVNVQGFRREPHLVDLGNNIHQICEGVRIVGFINENTLFTTLLIGFAAMEFLNGERNIDIFN